MGKLRSELIQDKRSRKAVFAKRNKGLKKKIHELATLCDIEACLVSYGRDGELETWPADKAQVVKSARRYWSIPKQEREKHMIFEESGGVIEENKVEDLGSEGSCPTISGTGVEASSTSSEPSSEPAIGSYPVSEKEIDELSDIDELAKIEGLLSRTSEKYRARIEFLKSNSVNLA